MRFYLAGLPRIVEFVDFLGLKCKGESQCVVFNLRKSNAVRDEIGSFTRRQSTWHYLMFTSGQQRRGATLILLFRIIRRTWPILMFTGRQQGRRTWLILLFQTIRQTWSILMFTSRQQGRRAWLILLFQTIRRT